MTYYRGPMVYQGNALELIFHPEGMIKKNTDGSFGYYYFKTDHTGSNHKLLSVGPGMSGGQQFYSMQSTDYYPFGLNHGTLGNLDKNRYLYSGKEYQNVSVSSDGSLLGLYDFGARYYDPLLGRWFNPDPALQGLNPYVYCGNNPIMYVDKDGEFFWLAIPMIVGGVMNVVNNLDGISNFWQGLGYFAVGAGNGALYTVNPALGATVGSGLSSGLNSIIGQAGHGPINWASVIAAAGTNAAIGVVTFGAFNTVGASGLTDKILNNSGMNNTIKNILHKTITGTVAGAGLGLIEGTIVGITTGEWNIGGYILQNATYGAVGGLVSGITEEVAYKHAIKHGSDGNASRVTEALSGQMDDYTQQYNDKAIGRYPIIEQGTDNMDDTIDGGSIGLIEVIGTPNSQHGTVRYYIGPNKEWQPSEGYRAPIPPHSHPYHSPTLPRTMRRVRQLMK